MSTPTEAHTARVRASGYTTPQGVQMAAQFLADSPKQPEVAHARAKRLSEASNAQLSLICGELTAGEIRTLRAMLSYILRPPAEGKSTGYEGMTKALEIQRRSNEDVEQWLAQHIGNLRDGRDRMQRQIYSLKQRVSKIEKPIY